MSETPETLPGNDPPPYFDVLFARIQENDPSTLSAFGRHLHWGYWDEPEGADGSADDYAVAAERLCQLVCDAGQIQDGMHVLDCGCGFGGTIASLNERFSDCEFTGVNIDQRQLDRGREKVLPENGNKIDFKLANACDLPFEAEQFDVVLAVECIFHFPSREEFFEQAVRVLKPGGRLSICDFIPPEHVLPYLEAGFNPLHDDATQKSYGRIDVQYTTDRYRELGEKTGLTLDYDYDMTPNTLPTYPFLRSHMQGWRDAQLADDFDKATAMLQKASAKGMLQYKILSFKKA